MIVSVMDELAGPRIFSTASRSVRPRTCSPSSWVMMSPARTPAFAAGVSSMGEITFDELVLHRDLDAEPKELAAGLDLHVLVVFGVQEAGMRVEGRKHPVDGASISFASSGSST
jgi:hypothetical protein